MKWLEKYLTGVKRIDDQHKGLFEMSDVFRDALTEGRGERVYGVLLKSFHAYAGAHLGSEEGSIGPSQCAVAKQNVNSHSEFLQGLRGFEERYAIAGFEREAAHRLVEFVDDWLVDHICRIDIHSSHTRGPISSRRSDEGRSGNDSTIQMGRELKEGNWSMKTNNTVLASHRVVSDEEWLEARRALLREEKEAMKRHDEFTKRQRDLPWRKVEKSYVFASTAGDLSLSDLFEGRSQLFIKHFMMGPDQDWQCPGCTLEVSHVDGLLDYFEHHDMSYLAVGRAPIDQIEAVRRKMGWRFKWVSSFSSDFNYDFHVSFRPEELANQRAIYNFREFDPKNSEDLSGNSIFYKDQNGQVFHTYSTFGRGGEQFLGIYGFFDLLPKGREENGPTHSLPDWASFKTKHIHNCKR